MDYNLLYSRYRFIKTGLNNFYKVIKKNILKPNYKHIITFHIGAPHINKSLVDSINNLTNFISDTLIIFTVNARLTHNILKDIKSNFGIYNKQIVILIVKNKGMDIGGFYIALQYIKSNNINYQYITKLHTKTNKFWLLNLVEIYKLDNLKKYFNLFANDNNINVYQSRYCNIVLDNLNVDLIVDICEKNNINIKKIYVLRNSIFKNDNSQFDPIFFKQQFCSSDRISRMSNERIIDLYFNNSLYKKNFEIYSSELYTKLKNNVPFFNAGSIATYKKQVIDKLLNIVPLSVFHSFPEGYSSNISKNDSTILHAIERLLGICVFLIK